MSRAKRALETAVPYAVSCGMMTQQERMCVLRYRVGQRFCLAAEVFTGDPHPLLKMSFYI